MSVDYCQNENDNSFLNRCYRQVPNNELSVIASFVKQWVNPRTLAIATTFFILFLPFIQKSVVKDLFSLSSRRRYRLSKLFLIHFLHRICYTLVLDVGLYAVFRQLRPCRCLIDGSWEHVGSIYGMPSGDAMSGAIFAAFLFDHVPFGKIFIRISAVIIMILIAMERVILGYHSIAQVTVGASIGIVGHIYSTRAPQGLIFSDTIIQIILGAVSLTLDSNLVFSKDDHDNLLAWFIWGVSFQVFVCGLLIKMYLVDEFKPKELLSSLYSIRQKEKEVMQQGFEEEEEQLTKQDGDDVKHRRKWMIDVWFTIGIFIVGLCSVNFFSSLVTQYGWLVRTK